MAGSTGVLKKRCGEALLAFLMVWSGLPSASWAQSSDDSGKWVLKSQKSRQYFVPAASIREGVDRTPLGDVREGKRSIERGQTRSRVVTERVVAEPRTQTTKRRVPLGISRERDAANVIRSIERWRDETVLREVPVTEIRQVRITGWQEREVQERFQSYHVRTSQEWADEVWGRLSVVDEYEQKGVRDLSYGPWKDREQRLTLGSDSEEGPATEHVLRSEDGSRLLGSVRLSAGHEAGSSVRGGVDAYATGGSRGAAAARHIASARESALSGSQGARARGSASPPDLQSLLALARDGIDLVDSESGAAWHLTSDGTRLTFAVRGDKSPARLLRARVDRFSLAGDRVTLVGDFVVQVGRSVYQSRELTGRAGR